MFEVRTIELWPRRFLTSSSVKPCASVALLFGTLEFAGPNERDGWPLAGTVVPIAYIAWSLWLIALGIFLLT